MANPPVGAVWLDPAKTSLAVPHPDPPGEQLPPEVRDFGFIPDLDALRPGDVLLVSDTREPFISRQITAVQRKAGFDDWHSQWHHAAVYVGNNLICEAQRKGVQAVPIFRYLTGKHRLRVRRDPNIDELVGYKLALAAALKLKYRYSLASVVQLYFQAKSWGWNGSSGAPRVVSDRATICSQLFADAYGVATEKTLDIKASPAVSPAHLSTNKTLADVHINWLSLANLEAEDLAD